MVNRYIIHTGILGMKWGVRKNNKPKSGSNTYDRKDNRNQNYKRDNKSQNYQRDNRNRNYKRNDAPSRPKRSNSKAIALAVVTTVATTTASVLVRHYVTKGIKALDATKETSSSVKAIWDLPVKDLKDAGFPK